MPPLVAMGAVLQCSFGAAPSSLVVLPTNRVTGTYVPLATINDNVPMVNILPFAMCTSLANPTVAAATAAALGVLTPMPCVPVIPAPWVPGSPPTQIGHMPALDANCTCMCAWAGVIKINSPGQTKVTVK
jgi:hypothetical protein